MNRVYVITALYNQLEEIALVHGMMSGARLLDLLLRTQQDSLTDASRPLLRLLANAPSDGVTAVRASYEAAHFMQQLALVYDVPQVTIASYIVQDSLPILRTFPESIPGFAELKRTHMTIPSDTMTFQIGVYKEVQHRIAEHIQQAQMQAQYHTVNDYIRAALRALPSSDIVDAITEGRSNMSLVLPLEKMQGTKGAAVRVELDTYYTLKELARITGASVVQIASYILLRSLTFVEKMDLRAAQAEAQQEGDSLQNMMEVYFKSSGPH